jgi:curved DNA-binding protein
MPRDFYEILGVSRSASADEIKSAYRRLAQRYHPDRNPGDKEAEAKFKEISSAHDVLSDSQKKSNYDRFGSAEMPGSPGFGGGFPGGGKFDQGQAEELFKQFFGGGGASGGGSPFSGQQGSYSFNDLFGGAGPKRSRSERRRATEPEPVESEVVVPFHTAAFGGSVNISLDNGREINVKVPAGIEEGKKLRVPPSATNAGELLLRVRIADHPYFRREGNDVFLDVPISIVEATLGGKVDVPTVEGTRLEVKIPPATPSGAKLRLRGKGIKGGDQFLVFKILPPEDMSEEGKAIMKEFAEKANYDPRASVLWKN